MPFLRKTVQHPLERKIPRRMWTVLKEFLAFLRQEKKWWLVPLVVILVLLGLFLALSTSSPLAPFLYPLF